MKMLRLFLVLTFLCGAIYPLTITLIGQGFFSEQAQGSLIIRENKIIGSKLLAQKFSKPEFFHSRPSAADYATVASGASQASPTQEAGKKFREEKRAQLPAAGVDAWTTSGSGLDPHISPKTAYAQRDRIVAARGISLQSLTELIDKNTEGPTFGIWGQPRVNVLELNIALMTVGNNANTR